MSSLNKKILPLGKFLIEKGLISKDQLETALHEQRRSDNNDKHKLLGAILVDMGFITSVTLNEVLAEQSGIKNFSIKSAALDYDLINKVPKNIATKYKILPVKLEGKNLSIVVSDIYNVLSIDQIRRFFPEDYKITTLLSSETDIMEAIDQYYGYEMSVGGILKEIETGNSQLDVSNEENYLNPTVRLVDAILVDAIKLGASDIHFEPEDSFLRLRYRIDGKMIQIRSFHKGYWAAIAVRIKIMSAMNIAENRKPQDGRITYNIAGKDIDFRVATHPTIHGENIVMRILDKQKSLLPLTALGFSEHNEKLLKKLLKRPEGIVVVTGPTGSGKTTTLYSVLNYINDIGVNIMTLENPVEYKLPLIRQSDIKSSSMNFDDGVKSLLRQDPDIIFIGEIRDQETANMALRASMTGHRVFSTLHTNNSISAIPRLIDIGVPPYLLSGSLICSMAQRLVRKLCNNCKEEYTPDQQEIKIVGSKIDKLYRRKGCDICMGIGYKGRIAVSEILPIDAKMNELIATNATIGTMLDNAKESGFIPIAEDGIGKVIEGITDLEELIRVVDLTDRF